MAHIAIRKYQTKDGLKWTATEAVFNSETRNSIEKKIEPMALQALGFSENMTPDQARAHAKKLNRLNAIERKEQESKIKAAERLTDLIVIEGSIVPPEVSTAFVLHLEKNWYGGLYNLRKMVQHWNLIQKMLTTLKIQPHEYFDRQKDIYRYFSSVIRDDKGKIVKKACSKSYVEKLIKVINAWGEFYSSQAKTFYKKLPNPKGIILEAIVDASDADGLGAAPLNEETLKGLKFRLPPGQYEYMHVTLWLGLRPSELDAIMEDAGKIKARKQGNITVVSVYQAKLVTISKERRWKNVPLIHEEMVKAYSFIKDGILDKPLVKTLQKALPDLDGIGLYSGRKGFTDLMLGFDQSLEDIAMWLGHASIERTWRHYKNKSVVNFKEIKNK